MDGLLHVLALDANELSVLTAVRTEGHEAESPSSKGEKEAQAPCPGHTSDFLSGDAVSVLTADSAWGSAGIVVVSEVDDHGALLGRGRVIGRRRGRGRLGIAVGSGCTIGSRSAIGLCVHVFVMIINNLVIY